MIKGRGLASPSGCCAVSGQECPNADLGWLQEVGLVDGGWRRRCQTHVNSHRVTKKPQTKQRLRWSVFIQTSGPVGKNVQSIQAG